MAEKTATIARFGSRADAESARERLLEAGFSADRITILGEGHPPRTISRSFKALVRAGAYVLIAYGTRKETDRGASVLATH
ncbi:MAG: hypothetical protein ABII00_10195 [Elusimicrobiota bacterium]